MLKVLAPLAKRVSCIKKINLYKKPLSMEGNGMCKDLILAIYKLFTTESVIVFLQGQ